MRNPTGLCIALLSLLPQAAEAQSADASPSRAASSVEERWKVRPAFVLPQAAYEGSLNRFDVNVLTREDRATTRTTTGAADFPEDPLIRFPPNDLSAAEVPLANIRSLKARLRVEWGMEGFIGAFGLIEMQRSTFVGLAFTRRFD